MNGIRPKIKILAMIYTKKTNMSDHELVSFEAFSLNNLNLKKTGFFI